MTPQPPLPRTVGALTLHAETRLPTRHGVFRMIVFTYEGEPGEHVAMVHGDVQGARDLLVRVHSECVTSEIFGSLKCDCREQLQSAMARVGRAERGMVIYLRQEGRGIGLINKVRAYALQEQGADTIEANQALGLPVEGRRYHAAAALLEHLGVISVKLCTNNPDKLEKLAALGTRVTGRVPVIVAANPYSARYLQTKRDRMAHLLGPDVEPDLAPDASDPLPSLRSGGA